MFMFMNLVCLTILSTRIALCSSWTTSAWTTNDILQISLSRRPADATSSRITASRSERTKQLTRIRNSVTQQPEIETTNVLSQDTSVDIHNDDYVEDLSAWQILAGNIGTCLIAADSKRDDGYDGAATGWKPWIEEKSAFLLQQCIDKLIFQESSSDSDNRNGGTASVSGSFRSESYMRWIRWMKATPSPLILDMTDLLREAASDMLTEEDFDERIDQTIPDFLGRMSCKVFVLPSGQSLNTNLRSAPGSMIYGKVLFGGVTRFRLLGTAASNQQSDFKRPPRRVGERTVISNIDQSKPSEAWLQYGGPERSYTAVDIGPTAFMEIILLPKTLMHKWDDDDDSNGLSSSSSSNNNNNNSNQQKRQRLMDNGSLSKNIDQRKHGEMTAMDISSLSLDPHLMFQFPTSEEKSVDGGDQKVNSTQSVDGQMHSNDNLSKHYTSRDLENSFSSVLGGLQPEIRAIIRRVLDGRFHSDPAARAEQLQLLLDLGLSPVRGLLLYGDPGCGKTALAREISRLLTDRPPKVISAPELLDRWVGGSERLVRELFADAEAELLACNGDITKSGLHVIIIDELDAVFRKRSASDGSGEVTRASAVNQILVKLDGVNSLGNILVIGTTNRRELLDPALQRPGRLEVAVHVPRPDVEGRRQIFDIYFGPLRERGRLSQPLCRAIDGTRVFSNKGSHKPMFNRLASNIVRRLFPSERKTITDLAADRWTGGFSGAEIEGLVRCAASIALSRARKDGSGVDGLIITLEDVSQALKEVKQ